MASEQHGEVPTCQGACQRCPTDGATGSQQAGAPEGWALVLAACATFLLPLATAVAGAIIAGGTDTGRLAGTCAGLAAGLIAAFLIGKLAHRPHLDARPDRRDAFPTPAGKENS